MAKAIVLVAAVVLVIVTLCESAPSSSSPIELVRRDINSCTEVMIAHVHRDRIEVILNQSQRNTQYVNIYTHV